MRRPTQIRRGADMAGEVVAVGAAVTRFRVGDEVFGMAGGAFGEYVRASEDAVVPKPANVTFEQAAAVPMAGLTALQGLRAGGLRSGQRVLINGASGGVGTFAGQLAVASGAEVTAVCSTRNVEAVRSLGARHVIDYTREDFLHSGETYDLILDVAGNRTISDRRRALGRDGSLVVLGGTKTNRWIGPMASVVTVPLAGRFGSRTMTMLLTKPSREDLLHLPVERS
jgi:NADPH:quinone reductase-like Zn-dependent oxidoreductase